MGNSSTCFTLRYKVRYWFLKMFLEHKWVSYCLIHFAHSCSAHEPGTIKATTGSEAMHAVQHMKQLPQHELDEVLKLT